MCEELFFRTDIDTDTKSQGCKQWLQVICLLACRVPLLMHKCPSGKSIGKKYIKMEEWVIETEMVMHKFALEDVFDLMFSTIYL